MLRHDILPGVSGDSAGIQFRFTWPDFSAETCLQSPKSPHASLPGVAAHRTVYNRLAMR